MVCTYRTAEAKRGTERLDVNELEDDSSIYTADLACLRIYMLYIAHWIPTRFTKQCRAKNVHGTHDKFR